jgi:hypothetical protein
MGFCTATNACMLSLGVSTVGNACANGATWSTAVVRHDA